MEIENVTYPEENPAKKRKVSKHTWKKQKQKEERRKPSRLPPEITCEHNNDRFKCTTLSRIDIETFHQQLYSTADKIYQDVFLLKYMQLSEVTRHRIKNDRYKPPDCSTKYFIETTEKKIVPVCLKTFCDILDVSRFRLHRLAKKVFNGVEIEENRGGFRMYEQFEGQKEQINQFLDKLQYVESHYCRSWALRKYLPVDLNISKLYRMFVEQYTGPKDQIPKESYFRHVLTNCCNIAFGTPLVDVCSKCLAVEEQLKHEADEAIRKALETELAIHKQRADAFYHFLRQPKDFLELQSAENTCVLSFACQKNLPLLRVSDPASYYSRNLYLYNFTVVRGYASAPLTPDNVTAFCWTENTYTKNSNVIASCLLHEIIGLNLSDVKYIRLISDGCAGHSRNTVVLAAVMKWFHDLAPGNVENVEFVFPVPGHCCIPPDCVFAQIERRLKRLVSVTGAEDYLAVIRRFATVKLLSDDQVPIFDVKRSIEPVIKPATEWPFEIPNAKRIMVSRDPRGRVQTRGEAFYKYDSRAFCSSFLKSGKTLADVHFTLLPERNSICEEKARDLAQLLEKHFGPNWKAVPSLQFFVYLLDVELCDTIQESPARDTADAEDECSFILDLAEIAV